jgi:hypothetical protein
MEIVARGRPRLLVCFYIAPALLNHNKDEEFRTVIAEAKYRLIIVDDELTEKCIFDPQHRGGSLK